MFVSTIGPPGAKIMLVGEAPGEEENYYGKPFIQTAPAGRQLSKLLGAASINRNSCLITNVARMQPPANKMEHYFHGGDIRKPRDVLLEWIELLKKEIILHKPNIVIGLGKYALWALTGESVITSFRGYIMESSLVQGQKVLCTYHPGKLLRESKYLFETVLDLRKAAKHAEFPGIPPDDRTLIANPSYGEFRDFIKHATYEHDGPVAIDIETKNPGCHVDIIGIATTPKTAISYELVSNAPKLTTATEAEMWSLMADLCNSKQTIFHNGPFDVGVLWHHNRIKMSKLFFDTFVASHILWPESPRSLNFVSSICLDVPPWKHTQTTMAQLYNASDAANTFGCYQVMDKQLDINKLREVFDFEMSQIEVAIMMQLQGIPVNEERRLELLEKYKAKIKEIEAALNEKYGRAINYNSSAQIQKLLYDEMNLEPQFQRRKSVNDPQVRTADSKALKKLSRMYNNPDLDRIIDIKKHLKTLTFLQVNKKKKKKGIPFASPAGRIHTCYNITGSTSLEENKGIIVDDEDSYKSFARWSSSESIIIPYGPGNLQNIPGKARTIYTAPPGKVYLSADYVQAEAVVVAYLIGDAKLIELFEASFGKSRSYRTENFLDVHKLTASTMFKIPLQDVTKEQRQIGKTIRHAVNYSAGPAVIAHRLGIGMREAKFLLELFHLTCPLLSIWHKSIQLELQTNGRVLTNLLGRKHKFYEAWGDDLFRSAYSYIPQSTVGDLLNKALVKTYHTIGSEVDIVLQLHDAQYLLIDNGKENIEKYKEKLREIMIMPLTHNGRTFYIDVDFSVGPSWGEMEELD